MILKFINNLNIHPFIITFQLFCLLAVPSRLRIGNAEHSHRRQPQSTSILHCTHGTLLLNLHFLYLWKLHGKWLSFPTKQPHLNSCHICKKYQEHHKRKSYLNLQKKCFLELDFLRYLYSKDSNPSHPLRPTSIP